MQLREKSKQKTPRALGLVFIIVTTIIIYVVSLFIVTSDDFYYKTGGGFLMSDGGSLTRETLSYLVQILSCACPALFYVLNFNKVANANLTEVSLYPNTEGKPYIYQGWNLQAVLGGVLGVVIALIIFLICLRGYELKNVMIIVWLLQTVCGMLPFWIPAFKPTEG